MLSERLAWLEYQNNIIDFYGQLQRLEQTAITAENWLKAQPTPATDPATVKAQLEKCKVRNSILLYCTSCFTNRWPHCHPQYLNIKVEIGLLMFPRKSLKILIQGKEGMVNDKAIEPSMWVFKVLS